MYLKEILETILPTRWSQYIMGMSIVASGFAYILPMFWPLSMLAMTDDAKQIFQVLLSVSTLLLGTLICLTLVIVAFHKQRKTMKLTLKKIKKNWKTNMKQNTIRKLKNLKTVFLNLRVKTRWSGRMPLLRMKKLYNREKRHRGHRTPASSLPACIADWFRLLSFAGG